MFLDQVFYHYRIDNPKASRNVSDKPFLINREFDYIKDKLMENWSDWQTYRFFYNYRKFTAYFWTIDRIALEFKRPFIERMSAEFKWARQNGDLDSNYFLHWQWQKLTRIIDHPIDYYLDFYPSNDLEELQKQFNELRAEHEKVRNRLYDIERSTAWKVGRYVTWLPRVIKRKLHR
jgi:hypothetical protein